jgi:hypothetical protein
MSAHVIPIDLKRRNDILDGTFYEDTADEPEALPTRILFESLIQRFKDKAGEIHQIGLE